MNLNFRNRILVGLAAFATVVAAVGLLPTRARAQDRTALLLPVPKVPEAFGMHFGRATPGMTSSSPLGFGPQLGDFFVGGNYQIQTRYSTYTDVSLTAGFGLGDAVDAIGIEAAFTASSAFDRNPDNRISASFKASRIVWRGVAVAAGVEGIALTGVATSKARESVYGAVSKVFDLAISGAPAGYFTAVTLNVGAGSGRFCREAVSGGLPAGEDNCVANVFASGGLRVNEWAGLVLDWTGQDLNVAASFVPFKKLPIIISPVLADLTGSGGDGVRFVMGFGMSFKY